MPRALVVDDDDSIREITQLALEVVAGWEVVTAESGAQAIDLAAKHQPDVVVLDLMMPGMDGLTTFRHLQAQESTTGIPVVLLTAKVQVGDRQLWDEMAVAGVISKPFDPMSLAGEISTMLGWT
ncbi:response regulator [Nocardioides deserti]|uniref:Response regulator n=1 Tax=Nocardioides deserti TaxID=1588644 RepID=A0ABR6U7H7_9ACTN|nr:response regulator [Nocardioides deserti]MBC2959816.1 response regulator [Nocardioides deserti]GGO75764.1 response regulator [Nocardioides deserti]